MGRTEDEIVLKSWNEQLTSIISSKMVRYAPLFKRKLVSSILILYKAFG